MGMSLLTDNINFGFASSFLVPDSHRNLSTLKCVNIVIERCNKCIIPILAFLGANNYFLFK